MVVAVVVVAAAVAVVVPVDMAVVANLKGADMAAASRPDAPVANQAVVRVAMPAVAPAASVAADHALNRHKRRLNRCDLG